jgi:hypothetical protein
MLHIDDDMFTHYGYVFDEPSRVDYRVAKVTPVVIYCWAADHVREGAGNNGGRNVPRWCLGGVATPRDPE